MFGGALLVVPDGEKPANGEARSSEKRGKEVSPRSEAVVAREASPALARALDEDYLTLRVAQN